jgi:uncharacterized hydrophobic protein (TIGR00341 family)
VALRELRVFLPADCEEEVEELLNELDLKQLWKGHDKEGTGLMLILAFDAFKAEKIVGKFEERFGQGERLRMVLSEAVASFPPIPMDEDEKKDEDANGDENNEPENGDEDEDEENPGRVIIEELLEDIRPSIAFDGQFMAMVILSAIVAAIGLIRDNTPVVIGAMVIAPLLGPNIALALGTTLGKWDLILRALKTNVFGLTLALIFSIVIGLVMNVDPNGPQIAARTAVTYSDLLLAFAAGAAGALSFTSGTASSLVGVMVAVALIPPLVAGGLLLGSGHWLHAYSALLLTMANIITINLAAVLTFNIRKVRPRRYWEDQIAKKMMGRAIILWLALVALLLAVISIS